MTAVLVLMALVTIIVWELTESWVVAASVASSMAIAMVILAFMLSLFIPLFR